MLWNNRLLRSHYKRAVQRTLREVGGDKAYIARINTDSWLLEMMYSEGDDEERFLQLRIKDGVAGHVVRTGEPHLCPDPYRDPYFVGPKDRVKEEIAVPLMRDGEAIGVILSDSYLEGVFSKSSVDTLAKIARDFVEEAESGAFAEKNPEFFDLCKTIVDRSRADLNGDQAYLALIDDFDRLNIEYSIGDDDEPFLTLTIDEGTTGQAARTAEPYFCRDVREDNYYKLSSRRVQQEIVVPIISDTLPIGVILVNSFSREVLDCESVRKLQALAEEFSTRFLELRVSSQTKTILEKANLDRHLGRKSRDLVLRANRELGLTSRCVSILYCSIRNFSSLQYLLAGRPDLISSFLARYYQRMRDAIHNNGGALDKFIGDGVIAIFGGLTHEKDDIVSANSAVNAAIEMRKVFGSVRKPILAEVVRETGLSLDERLGWGCAIHTAHVLFGLVATSSRSDLTAIGEGVNVAVRIEDHFKDRSIRISESVRARLDDAYAVQELGIIQIEDGPFKIFEVEGGDTAEE